MHSPQEISLKSPAEYGVVASSHAGTSSSPNMSVSLGDYKIIRRNGAVVGFEPSKISIAMTKAFLAVNGGQVQVTLTSRQQNGTQARLTSLTSPVSLRNQPPS